MMPHPTDPVKRVSVPVRPRATSGSGRPPISPTLAGLADPDPADARVDAYLRWLAANDRLDTPSATRAARELGRLGISICTCTPPVPGGRP